MQGPDFDAEAESELTITEMKALKRQKELVLIEKAKFQEAQREAEGISWGMSEDADEETDLSVNPFASTNNEELFLDDPKKTLRGYFEREGFDLDYRVDEMSPGTFVCRIELPITDSNGRPITAELCHKGKKKDCVLQAALEACRILDRHGVLRQAHHEPRRRKRASSDSADDDEFYDRTGDVERKRQQKAANTQSVALSHDELLRQEQELLEKIDTLNRQIDEYHRKERVLKKRSANDEDLDDFMSNLSKDKALDKTEIRRMRVELQSLRNDHVRLQKLIKIARPIDLPPLKLDGDGPDPEDKPKKLNLPLFGKRGGPFKFGKSATATASKKSMVTPAESSSNKDYKTDEEEIEEKEEVVTNVKMDPIPSEEKRRKLSPSNSCEESIEATESLSRENSNSNADEPTPSVDTADRAADDKAAEVAAEAAAVKKRRNRIRIRGDRYRENVDIDDSIEHKDVAKYSTWVPPENQSGDGSTNLNQKYGY